MVVLLPGFVSSLSVHQFKHYHLQNSDVDVRDLAQMTPAMWAAYYDNEPHLIKLLQSGANITVR